MEKRLFAVGKPIDAIERLMTIPGIGNLTAIMIYAWVGDGARSKPSPSDSVTRANLTMMRAVGMDAPTFGEGPHQVSDPITEIMT